MKALKIAVSATLQGMIQSEREQVPLAEADWMEVSAAVLSDEDLAAGKLEEIESRH